MKPIRVEFSIGETIHKQPLKLILERDSAGSAGWTIHQEASCQRDESTTIRGIPEASLRAIAEALNSVMAK